MTTPEAGIKNGSLIMQFFGRWPSFHDAEVLEIHLDRQDASLLLRLYAFEMLSDTDAEGYYKQTKHCHITMKFLEIDELELFDFNRQNVISALQIESAENGMSVSISSSYGVGGKFRCKVIEIVSLQPVTSPEP